MHGNVGDWLVVKGAKLDDPYRRGEIVELVHADGAPPYHVHWLDTDRVTLVFPGPDSHIEHRAAEKASQSSIATASDSPTPLVVSTMDSSAQCCSSAANL